MKNCKGQVFTTDFIVSFTVLIFILVISFSAFSLIQNSLNEEEFYSEMQEKAINATQILISTSGQPNSWEKLNDLNINSIGLAKEKNVLDENKINKLINLNATKYNEIKEILGLQKYNFYFKITSMNNNTIKEFGVFPSTENKTILIERYVLLNEKERKFILGVFK